MEWLRVVDGQCAGATIVHSRCSPLPNHRGVLLEGFMPTLSHQGPPLQNFTLGSVPYLNILSVTYLVPSGHWSHLSDRGYWGKTNINQQLFRCITFSDKKFYFDTQLQQAMSYPKEINLMRDVSDDLAGLCKIILFYWVFPVC